MKIAGLNRVELLDAYCKEVRSLLELAVPLWHSALTQKQSAQIEKIQKVALAIILENQFTNYDDACQMTKMDYLKARREKICLKFIKKNIDSKYSLLELNPKSANTRSNPNLVKEFFCRTTAY